MSSRAVGRRAPRPARRWTFVVAATLLGGAIPGPAVARQVDVAPAAGSPWLPSPAAQVASRTFGRAGTGFGAGVTIGAVAMSAGLVSGGGNACRGSGDYLQVCRVLFVGGTALAGGVGALAGALTRKASPSGRARPVLLGAAVGSLIPFLASLGACEQEEPTNPGLLCGEHGMAKPGITAAAAAAGGLIGYLIGGAGGLEMTYLGPVPTRTDSAALGLTFSWTPPGGRFE